MDEKAGKIGLEVNEKKNYIYIYIYMIMSTPESRRKPKGLKTEEKLFTGVSCFNYLGNVVNNGNRNDNCINKRIQVGNRDYFANLSTLKHWKKTNSVAFSLQVNYFENK
jgi:hypothetical protein